MLFVWIAICNHIWMHTGACEYIRGLFSLLFIHFDWFSVVLGDFRGHHVHLSWGLWPSEGPCGCGVLALCDDAIR